MKNLAASFEARHPVIAAWWKDSTFEFAVSLREQCQRKGTLSDRQIAAAYRSAESLKRAQDRAASAPSADVSAIHAAFASASASGLKRPRLTLAGYVVSPAGAASVNVGAIYAKRDGVYLGKFLNGLFVASRDCNDATRDELVKIASDPHGAAVAHGKLTGNCACCNRPLSDPESVARGVGPVCATRFGW